MSINFGWGLFEFDSSSIPTDEDRLDINFRSIVSDLRSIMGGTLGPRSWSDISSTWHYEPKFVQRRIPDTQLQRDRINARNQFRSRVRKMAKLLILNGESPIVAFDRAEKLLSKKGD